MSNHDDAEVSTIDFCLPIKLQRLWGRKIDCDRGRQRKEDMNGTVRNIKNWAKQWSLGWVNPASWLPLAAGGEYTQPRDHSFAQPCICLAQSQLNVCLNYLIGKSYSFRCYGSCNDVCFVSDVDCFTRLWLIYQPPWINGSIQGREMRNLSSAILGPWRFPLSSLPLSNHRQFQVGEEREAAEALCAWTGCKMRRKGSIGSKCIWKIRELSK